MWKIREIRRYLLDCKVDSMASFGKHCFNNTAQKLFRAEFNYIVNGLLRAFIVVQSWRVIGKLKNVVPYTKLVAV